MIYPYPNKVNPTSWRVQCKKLNIQEYFPFKRYGSDIAALLEAIYRVEEINKELKKLKPRTNVAILFTKEGHFKDIGVVCGKQGIVLKAQPLIDGKQVSTTRTISNRSVQDAYNELAIWIMEKRNIKLNPKIKRQLKLSFPLFEEKYKDKLSLY